MKFFDKSNNEPERYPENSKGDFYVENGVCISCGAPEAEASDLIEHSNLEYGHCYFKKQPQTDDEIERAINAIAVSCISGLRYGGTEEKILKRLYEKGETGQCDHKPKGNYKTIIWNKVTFQYQGTLQDLSDFVTGQLVLGDTHLIKQIVNLNTNNNDHFEFVYRWTNGLTGNIFDCSLISNNKFIIRIDKEKEGYDISIRGNAIVFNLILCNNPKVSDILWFDQDDKQYTETQIR